MRSATSYASTDGELRSKAETERPIGRPRDPADQVHLTWRCGACGETGRLRDRLPTSCPGCADPSAEVYYRDED
ncbi:DUF7130 family rubredoxin-like protein [Halopiger thermotolerans]